MTNTPENDQVSESLIVQRKTAIATSFASILREEGFSPEIDPDGDLSFKFEGGHYILLIDEDDANYIRLCFPGFSKVELSNTAHLLDVIDDTQKTVKLVKILLSSEYVWAVIEAFIPDHKFFKITILRYLSILQAGGRVFVEKYKASETVTTKE